GVPPNLGLVTFRSSSPVAHVPASLTIPTGGTSISFPITTVRVQSTTVVRLTATFNGESQTATLTLFGPLLASLTPHPTTLRSGTFGFLVVKLFKPAPASGVTVTLASANPSAVSLSQGSVSFAQGERS